jgi:hypothetical protein
MSLSKLLPVILLLLKSSFVMGQFAPASLQSPSQLFWSGNYSDSLEGVVFETKAGRITSGTTFNFPGGTGTYTYTKTGSNTATVAYTSRYAEDGGFENETGSVIVTFTSSNGGTFTSSGSYSGSDNGVAYNGTFSNGSGTFSFGLKDPYDLVGTWTTPTEDGGIAYITFLDDGTYHHTEDGTADDSGRPGMEIGNYTWNTTTGAVSTEPTVDQNGEWGLSHNAPDIKFFVSGGQLSVTEDGDAFALSRPATSSSAIVGSWVIVSEGRPAVVVFLADGTYRHSEAGAPVGGGFSGMEKGTYLWNPTTKALSANATLDQNGEWGLSHPLAPFTVTVSGDQITILEGGLPFVGQRTDSTTALSSFLRDASIPYNQRGALDDFDNDGASNSFEYALGLDPTKSDPAGLPSTSKTASTFSYIYKRARTNVTYLVQASTDLGNASSWTTEGITQGTPDTNGNVTATIPITGGARFVRLQVTLAP